jgi:hypothetical protein
MIVARPTVAQERWLVLADRYPGLRAAAEQAGGGGGWTTTTWLARCLGFLLGLLATGLLGGVLATLPSPLLVGGLLLMVAAEWLVARRRVFRSGIEEAVAVCGAVAITVQILIWSDVRTDALGVALVCTAVLLVGWRLLNPLFTTLAAAGYTLAIALVDGRVFGDRMNIRMAAVVCVALGLAALLAGGREWRRPAHDRMVAGLVIVMPWLAHGWLAAYDWRDSDLLPWTALALALAILAANLAVGVRRRLHAPLIGALGNLACIAHALQVLVTWPVHWHLIAAGGLALAATVILDRTLRERIDGVTSRAIDEPEGIDLAELAGAAQISPAPGPAPQPGVQGQGGEFGGGGASGKF